jgi:hypothetical protein
LPKLVIGEAAVVIGLGGFRRRLDGPVIGRDGLLKLAGAIELHPFVERVLRLAGDR